METWETVTMSRKEGRRPGLVQAALAGTNLDDNTLATAVTHVCDGVDPNADLYASSDYRCHLAQVHTRRGIQAAKARVR